ncbi:MAG: nuclear transport factor 2 family protein [Gelidibacter sp.]|nr:nuclear transport factor 2 family protein [Gelidibacter sp.]
MKKIMLIVIIIATITACKNEVRYTQNSPEIETYKKVITAYEMGSWESMVIHYSDTAKILNNVNKKNAQTVAQLVAQNKQDAAIFSSWKYVPEESEYEMVVTDKQETWVNFWGLWQGRLTLNNQLYEIPVHITARFIDGKIVREVGYWDISAIALDLQQLKEDAPPEAIMETKE